MAISFRSEAIEVLRKSKKSLRIPEIFKAIVKRGNLKTKGSTPESTLYAIISEDIKKEGFGLLLSE